MFYLHGKEYNIDKITFWLESILETYSYETPETILLFLKKAGNGDFGKFFGEPDIGTVRIWFADYLGNTIVPERERLQTSKKETYDSQREQIQSPLEYLKNGGTKPVNDYLRKS